MRRLPPLGARTSDAWQQHHASREQDSTGVNGGSLAGGVVAGETFCIRRAVGWNPRLP